MRIHDSELSNLILRIEQDKKFLPIHDVINLGALRDLVDLRIESSAEITALRLETARLNIDLQKVNSAHMLEQESLRAKLRDVTADRNNCESEGSLLASQFRRMGQALAAEQADHHKTLDSAEKAAIHIEEQTNAIHVATAEIASLQKQLAEITKKRNDAESEGSRLVSLLERLEDAHEDLKKEANAWAEQAGYMQTCRDRAVQCLINVQDYLRANGRNFPAAQAIIDEFHVETK